VNSKQYTEVSGWARSPFTVHCFPSGHPHGTENPGDYIIGSHVFSFGFEREDNPVAEDVRGERSNILRGDVRSLPQERVGPGRLSESD
jgi:hypothetical protein